MWDSNDDDDEFFSTLNSYHKILLIYINRNRKWMKTTHITSKEMENIFYTINAQHQICKVKMKRIFFNLWKIFHKISSLLFNAQCWLIEYPSWLDAVGRSDWTQSINDKAIPKRLFMDRDVEISQDFRKVQSFGYENLLRILTVCFWLINLYLATLNSRCLSL